MLMNTRLLSSSRRSLCPFRRIHFWMLLLIAGGIHAVRAAEPLPGDALLKEYFRAETARLTENSLQDIQTAEDWNNRRVQYRQQLQEMLGLSPWPEKTPLKPQVSNRVEQEDFVVENVSFQSLPGLYVTGNFYRPKTVNTPLPAILYVCGHASAKKDGVSFGNKTAYQRHGIWFARNGYACLIIDTIQLGEIQGIHHGTYNLKRWDWISRGYTPAGTEAWNGIRALDYLQTRAEVDPDRMGMTGRSGGGAYTWFVAALDDRVKAAVPVAGITSLKNHVVDGCVAGHCDCMYPVNLYGWDFPQLAALVAPRPLLISNQDKDRIFPLDGVADVYFKTRRIYELLGARDRIGLCIAEGGHKDIQELRVDAFHWFNRFLKGEDPLIRTVAEPMVPQEDLRVFQTLPADERVTTVQDWLVPVRNLHSSAKNMADFTKQIDQARTTLLSRLPRGAELSSMTAKIISTHTDPHSGIRVREFQFDAGKPYRLSFFVLDHGEGKTGEPVQIEVLDQPLWDTRWNQLQALFPNPAFAGNPPGSKSSLPEFSGTWVWIAPRGVGPTRWSGTEIELNHIRRRFYLLGTTQERVQAEDVQRALQHVGQVLNVSFHSLPIKASGQAANWTVLAMFLIPGSSDPVAAVQLADLPTDPAVQGQLLAMEQLFDWPDMLIDLGTKTRQLTLHVTSDDEAANYRRISQISEKLGGRPFVIAVRK